MSEIGNQRNVGTHRTAPAPYDKEKQSLTEKEALTQLYASRPLSSVRARGNEALAFKYSYLI